jgi:hypothetical protein
MKFNKWTMGLAAVGVVSLASAARADETKMSQVQTALSNTTLSGYVDTAAQWNLGSQNGGATPGSVGLIGNAGNADGFTLNAVDVALDKPQDESPWAAGYHVELMYGPSTVGGAAGTANANIRQAYLALRTPVGNSAIDWKVGVWDTIIGYESSSDGANPNYTRSYGYGMEPTTHTGILGTYKINDMFTVQAGIADGSQAGSGVLTAYAAQSAAHGVTVPAAFGPAGVNGLNAQESQKAYMGAVAFTAPDSWGWAKGTTINAGVINNDDSYGAVGATPATAAGTTDYYVGATVPTPLTALKVGAAWDYLDIHDAHHTFAPIAPNLVGFTPNSDTSVWNMGLYANYQANDKLSFNARGEHMEVNGTSLRADEFTATVQYALWANVLSRVEFRCDHLEHGAAFDNSSYSLSGTNIHNNAYMVALNLIYQF